MTQQLQIRAIRKAKKMSLRELAVLANVSTGLISQVERGLTQPSLDTLRQIAKALEVPLFSLFETSVADVTVLRQHQRMTVSSASGIAYQRISPGKGNLEILEGFLPPSSSSAAEKWSHPAEECVWVTEGELTVLVGEEVYILKQGDSCYFDSRTPHAYVNNSSNETRFMVAITPPSY